MINSQAQTFVRERLRPQAEHGRAFLALAANDASNFTLGHDDGDSYQDFFMPIGNPANSQFIEDRTDVPHVVNAIDVAEFMGLLSRIKAIITDDDIILIDKFCVRKLEVI